MGTGCLQRGRAAVTGALLGGGWTKVLPHSEGPTVGSATSGETSRDTASAFLAKLRKILSVPAGFPPKANDIFFRWEGRGRRWIVFNGFKYSWTQE